MIRLWRRQGRASGWKDVGYTTLAGLAQAQDDAGAAGDVDVVRFYSVHRPHQTQVHLDVVVTYPALVHTILGPMAAPYLVEVHGPPPATVTDPTGTVTP